MGVLDNVLLVAIFFTKEGRYERYALRPVPWNPDPNLLPGQQHNRHAEILVQHMQQWAKELEMTAGDIYVRHFAFPDWQIGIAEWPLADWEHVQQRIATGAPIEDDFLMEWQQKKRWVLHWHKEYWMNEDGEIGDT